MRYRWSHIINDKNTQNKEKPSEKPKEEEGRNIGF